mmetsp:Transcript_47749/g.104150  ORF Transcript_47749/g.104150 Transcript_47749/m.104150 type:complete len:210 (+) Transcript_47749:883-1512(+)
MIFLRIMCGCSFHLRHFLIRAIFLAPTTSTATFSFTSPFSLSTTFDSIGFLFLLLNLFCFELFSEYFVLVRSICCFLGHIADGCLCLRQFSHMFCHCNLTISNKVIELGYSLLLKTLRNLHFIFQRLSILENSFATLGTLYAIFLLRIQDILNIHFITRGCTLAAIPGWRFQTFADDASWFCRRRLLWHILLGTRWIKLGIRDLWLKRL